MAMEPDVSIQDATPWSEAGRQLDEDVLDRCRQALISAGVPEAEQDGRVAAFRTLWREVNVTDVAAALINRAIPAPSAAAIVIQFAEQPLIDAKLRQELAESYQAMGLPEQAAPLLANALHTRTRLLGEAHTDTLWSALKSVQLLRQQDNFPAAEELARQTLAISQRTLGNSHSRTHFALSALANILHDDGRLKEAETLYRQVLSLQQKSLEPLDNRLLVSMSDVGYVLMSQGRLAEAEPYLTEALDRTRRRWGEDHRKTLDSEAPLGQLIALQGRLSEAEPLYRNVLDRRRRLLGEAHPDTVMAINNMGFLLFQQARYDEAATYFEEALGRFRLIYGPSHRETLTATNNLCALLSTLSRFDDAEPHCVEAAEGFGAFFGAEHRNTLVATNSLAGLRIKLDQHDLALALLSPMLAAARTAFVDDNAVILGRVLTNLGVARAGAGQFEEAQRDLLEARDIFASAIGAIAKDHLSNVKGFADLYTRWDRARPNRTRDSQEDAWKQVPADAGKSEAR